jgi:hypothetical protein
VPWEVWALRAAWLVLPVTVGAALDGRGLSAVAVVGTWVVWTLGVVAVLVPRTTSLTFVRIAAPASLAVALWSGDPVGVVSASVTPALALLPRVTDSFVDGSSYGTERRFALRTPVLLLVGPVPLAWVLAVAGVAVGPLLLGERRWVPGVVATAVGVPVAAAAVRSLHQLARRWCVFVPAGLVLHDPVTMADAVLLPNRIVTSVEPAREDEAADALDLTGGAPGLAVAVHLREPVKIAPRRGDPVEATALLCCPSLPGAMVSEARTRRR